MITNCPCCGQTTAAQTPAEIVARNLPPIQSAILRTLAADFGSFVRTADIARQVWANDPNGGPDGTGVSISQAVRRMRPMLEKHGMTAESEKWLGYRVKAA
jgi:DNA-binding response OmpR family regulator